ncbi:DUF6264 family protein [Pseudolysinimonas sp.]|jgi:hypothetical protein|uniref:DUF6264 family protein n=1 Tax=Pseudolysinimonas sp. TaxID=2680009 RepID=UPI003783C679
MSEPNSASDPTPEVPKAPSFTYGSPAAQPVPPAPAAGQLPPPQYGERLPAPAGAPAPGAAPAAPAYAVPAYGAPAYGAPQGMPPVKRRRTWDLVLTIILLVLGLFGMGIGLIYAALFSDPVMVQEVFDEAYGQSGLGGWNGSVGAAPAIIAISHVVLYLVALGVSILLLVKNKVAFWVPLSAGVIAAIVFWGALFAIVLSDPSLMSGMTGMR